MTRVSVSGEGKGVVVAAVVGGINITAILFIIYHNLSNFTIIFIISLKFLIKNCEIVLNKGIPALKRQFPVSFGMLA